MTLEERVRKLEQNLHRLKTEYEQYFLGLVKLAPEKLAGEVAREVRALTATRITNTALRFQAQQAISRYNSYLSYWTRNLKDIEEGRSRRRPAPAATPAAAPPPAAPEPVAEAARPLVVSTANGDREGMDAFLHGLAAEYRRAGGGKSPDLERIRQAVEQQNKVIREKYGVEKVSYSVVNEGGKIKLKAVPVKAARP